METYFIKFHQKIAFDDFRVSWPLRQWSNTSRISAPTVIPLLRISWTKSSTTLKSLFIPCTNTASWAVSVVSVLWSISIEKNCRYSKHFFWLDFTFSDISSQRVMVLAQWLTSENSSFLSRHIVSTMAIIHFFANLQSVNSLLYFAMNCGTLQLARVLFSDSAVCPWKTELCCFKLFLSQLTPSLLVYRCIAMKIPARATVFVPLCDSVTCQSIVLWAVQTLKDLVSLQVCTEKKFLI